MKLLFLAICCVESGCDPTAVGAAGEIGVAQIRTICVDDVNHILEAQGAPICYRYQDRKSIRKSYEMFAIYTGHYAPGSTNYEQKARTWNGGPRGPSKRSTGPYWAKVRRELDRLRTSQIGKRSRGPRQAGRDSNHCMETVAPANRAPDSRPSG